MDPLERQAIRIWARAELEARSAGAFEGQESAWPEAVRRRWPDAQAHAAAAAQAVSLELGTLARRVAADLSALQRSARSASNKLSMLLKLVDDYVRPIGRVAACKRGCSHCCHIPVALTEAEAVLIGRAIGVRPHLAAGADFPGHRRYGYDQPCPFLHEGRCGIYANRPLACRLHLNLDRDDLLCRLVPGVDIPVPLADMRQLQQAYIELSGPGPLADIREFFPRGLSVRQRPAAGTGR